MAQRANRAERVFLAAQMADDRNPETRFAGRVPQPSRPMTGRRPGPCACSAGLNSRNPSSCSTAEPRRHRERLPGLRICPDVPVQIGAGQGHHQRSIRPLAPEPRYGGIALPGVQGQQQVVIRPAPFGFDAHPVPQVAQETTPAARQCDGCRCAGPRRPGLQWRFSYAGRYSRLTDR